jgi:drug/metabolite transporter (DMT)-like permease
MPASAQGVSAAWLRDFLALAAIWGASFLFMRLAVVDFGPMPTAALRVGIGALVLLPILLWRGQGQILRQHWRGLWISGMLSAGLPASLYAFALVHISTGLSSILNASVPMFAAVVAWLWLRERLDRWRGMGLALGFAGVVVLAWDQVGLRDGGVMVLWAVLACLASCLAYGLGATYTRQYLGHLPPLAIATGSQLGAFAGLALPAALTWPAQRPSTSAWLALLAVGVVCTGLAFLLFYRLIARSSPARTVTVTYLIPLFAVFYGVLLLDEHVTPAMVAGGLVILLGTALASGLLKPRLAGSRSQPPDLPP